MNLSETSPKLIPFVTGMADRFGAEIHLVFVARLFQYFTGIYVRHPAIEIFEKEVTEGAEKKLYEFKEEHFADFPDTQTDVVLGDAAEEILKYVQSEGWDLIIMGSHGRKGLEKVISGSVVKKVVKTAPVPVMVVKPYKIVTENRNKTDAIPHLANYYRL